LNAEFFFLSQQGGLDCRYLTTHLTERSFSVLSVTTIATPHRGSPFASRFLDTIGGPSRLPPVLALLDLLPNGGGDGKAFEFLTVENMQKFNEETPDVPGVKYYSWGASYEPGLIDTWKYVVPPVFVVILTFFKVATLSDSRKRRPQRWLSFRLFLKMGNVSRHVASS
jgi:hypothetical protein